MDEIENAINEMVELANKLTTPAGTPDSGVSNKLFEVTMGIFKLGKDARLIAIKEAPRIEDSNGFMTVVGDLIMGMPGQNNICCEALSLLSDSNNDSHWEFINSFSHIFERHVPRTELKDAIVAVWEKSDGVIKENTSYTLRKLGFSQLLGRWF